jgi:hypothetical protein
MDFMRRIGLAGLLLAVPIAAATLYPELASVKRVYVLSMGSGLDQYIANRIAENGTFEITTDPKLADAVLTDAVGEQFERRMRDLYAPPPEEKKSAASSNSGDASSGSSSNKDAETVNSFKQEEKPVSTFSRGRGNVFLIDRNSRKVLWSTYERPKNRSSDELNHTAGVIAKELKKAAAATTAGGKQ